MTSVESYNIDDLEPLLSTLRNTLGVVVADEQRSDLVERIEPLLATYQLDSLSSLAEHINSDNTDKIKSGLLDVISQSQSSWVLSAEVRSILQEYIFDQLPEKARVWIVGCQQGQLAYSVAMEAARYEHENGVHKNLELIATDISQRNIEYAKQATYTRQQLHDLADEDKAMFVTMNNNADNGQIKESIRQSVDFRQCDITKDFQSLGEMDLIICPDELVYFSNDRKAGIFKQFSVLLKSGGIFLSDNSQAIMTTAGGLERVEHPAGMFFRKTG